LTGRDNGVGEERKVPGKIFMVRVEKVMDLKAANNTIVHE
jgi:hypothetical protein